MKQKKHFETMFDLVFINRKTGRATYKEKVPAILLGAASGLFPRKDYHRRIARSR